VAERLMFFTQRGGDQADHGQHKDKAPAGQQTNAGVFFEYATAD
jgi:glucuronate isomerase